MRFFIAQKTTSRPICLPHITIQDLAHNLLYIKVKEILNIGVLNYEEVNDYHCNHTLADIRPIDLCSALQIAKQNPTGI